MYDVFIDEEKTQGYLGFLVVQNTPALQQLLFRRRESFENYRHEIKFTTVNNTNIRVILPWLNVFFLNDFCRYFLRRKWDGTLSHKRNVITKTIQQIKEHLNIKTQLVAFLDFDNSHQNLNLQNQIQVNAKILRCYHLNSKTFDMLQLCDILLQCSIKSEIWLYDKQKHQKLLRRLDRCVSMKKPELKKLIVSHAIKQNKKWKKLKIRL